MKTGILNAIKVIIGLVLIGLGWYGLGYGFATENASHYFFGGFLLLMLGGGIVLHVAVTAKD
ncbi:MAG: hypothetical protein REI64_03550 [Pedobacter sp.]|uniref:hypothetical protein n=1 Tax=Pedobacter sp. TaxID=1411316 RepID=UPI0028076772|nr:hypothetical protein [Pedobacter sp.]MDQ8003849.1 hypothetical protein [Pedobacter sp.]